MYGRIEADTRREALSKTGVWGHEESLLKLS